MAALDMLMRIKVGYEPGTLSLFDTFSGMNNTNAQ